ncbi:MAG: ATP-dependent Clp protease ATP-binding subunit [Syntrophomonadaceae bacterium]|nr:ATP-dependent Clp protease ATP-binding subunit [Syntrophomonadaceae bacterium]
MLRRFTQRAQRAIINAQEEAREMGHAAVGTEHILLGLIREGEGVGARAILALGVDLDQVREAIKSVLGGQGAGRREGTGGDLPITPRAKKVLNLAFDEAQLQGVSYVGTEHLLLAVIREEEGVAAQVLSGMGIKLDDVRAQVMLLLGSEGNAAAGAEAAGEGKAVPGQPVAPSRRNRAKSKTPVLDNYSRDLTQMAREQKLDPVIGREKEIERVVQVLSRRTKNNPVLIGDPGVGKTAIVEGLAQRIVENRVPEILADKRVVVLDLSTMVAGTKYRGEFEDRLTKVVNEIRAAGDIIVFIDELHTIVGAGAAEGAIDAANILKPALARGEFQCVGATTLEEYRKHVEKDAALERRFQPIMVEEPSVEETIEILKGLRDRYEAHHAVKITNEAIVAAANLSARYISDRFLPDKAIDLIDEASSKVRLRNYVVPEELKAAEARLEEIIKEKEEAIMGQEYETAARMRDEEQRLRDEVERLRREWVSRRSVESGVVTAEEIASVVSAWTGVPVAQMAEAESERLARLEEVLHQRVVGQDEAVRAVARAVRRARAGLKDPKRPIGSFVFLGPTGVGKTELARALAEALFGSESSLIRLDMSEYMEKHTVARIIGSPPGYVGYEEGGQLTERVRRKPYSVILLDEIEKAHPDVFNILLQVLDDGRLTDGKGRTVDFRNTVIIMTSNVGAESLRRERSLGFRREAGEQQDYERMKEQVMEKMKATFRPEFLNRLDEVIVFHSLTTDELKQIFELLIKDLRTRLHEQGFALEVTEAAKQHIIAQGYDPVFGARPLKRAIQRAVEDSVSEEIIARRVQPGDTIVVDVEDGKVRVTATHPAS